MLTFDLFVPLRTVRRDPGISVRSSAPSLMGLTSRGNATSGSRIMEVSKTKDWCFGIHMTVYCVRERTYFYPKIMPISLTAENPCELNCMPRGENFFYRHRSSVVDGTPCHPGRRDVCVEGVCKVGCTGWKIRWKDQER